MEGETGASCACEPDCKNKLCGSDGCGGSCAGAGFTLPEGCPTDFVNNQYVPEVCIAGRCCRPDCGNRDCGSDGCGGQCGTCGADEVCLSPQQYCVSRSSQEADDDVFTPKEAEVRRRRRQRAYSFLASLPWHE